MDFLYAIRSNAARARVQPEKWQAAPLDESGGEEDVSLCTRAKCPAQYCMTLKSNICAYFKPLNDKFVKFEPTEYFYILAALNKTGDDWMFFFLNRK